ncbi:MAG TPA: DUF2085 domain-containing protein [Anaerolineales bacterium]
MLTITLYTRKDCPPCDQARSDLLSLQDQFPHRLVEVDIDDDPLLIEKYKDLAPVVETGPYSLKAPFSRQNLQMTLGAAVDRRGQLEKIGGAAFEKRVQRGQVFSGADRLWLWFSRHYLMVFNIFIFLYVGLPCVAPTLMRSGSVIPARVLYKIYSPLCHQFGFRSFFLFGEQAYYPLSEAGLHGVKTFEQITGFEGLENPSSFSRLQAREFIGNETVGYKVALCERDVAIYGAMLLFGLFFALSGRRLGPLHWLLWVLLGLGPIGLDGFSQLFSQFNWPWLASLIPYRESTPFLRVLTGGLFGWMTAWYAYPYIEESMRETLEFFLKKSAIVQSGD